MHGINFGCRCESCIQAEFPPGIKRLFKARISRTKSWKNRTDTWYRLQGVAQSEQELAEMKTVINPNKDVQIVERQSAGGKWYGIYLY